MNLLAVGCSHRTTPVAVREKLGLREDQLPRALDALTTPARLRGRHPQHLQPRRAVRRPRLATPAAARRRRRAVVGFLAEFHGLPAGEVRRHLYVHAARRRRAPPVPRGRQPRQPRRRRGPDRRPGQKGLRAGPAAGQHRAAAQRPVPARPPRRQARPHRNRHQPGPRLASPAPPSITSARSSTTSATRPSSSSAPARWAS